MKKLLSILMTASAVLPVAACGSNEKETINFGALASLASHDDEIRDEIKSIAKHVGVALNKNVNIVLYDTYNEAIEDSVDGSLDLFMGSSASFWEANKQNNDIGILSTVAPKGDINEAGYSSIIATHSDNKDEWNSLMVESVVSNLKGKSFSFQSKESTSGGLLPMNMFWENTTKDDYDSKLDIFESDEYLGEVVLTGNHGLTVRNIFNKTTDFGAFYSNQLELTLLEDKSLSKDDIFVVHEIDAPGDPLWGNISESDNKKLNDYLEELNFEDNPELFQTDSVHFTTTDIQFVRASEDLEVYQKLKNLDVNETR